MIWSRFCYYALICFLEPLKSPSKSISNEKVCEYYSSDDVNRTSVIMEITTATMVVQTETCLNSGPIHTFLVHKTGHNYGHFQFPDNSIDIEHIIIVGQLQPTTILASKTEKRNKVESLSIFGTKITFSSRWLEFFYFKHVRFENVSIIQDQNIDLYLLNDHLESLVFINGQGLDPWHVFDLQKAKNLKVLKITGYNIPRPKSRTGSDIFQNLRVLDLQNNHIEALDDNFFSQKPSLKEVDLSNNLLKSFKGTFEPGLLGINFFGNPFMKDRETCINLENSENPDVGKRVSYCPAR